MSEEIWILHVKLKLQSGHVFPFLNQLTSGIPHYDLHSGLSDSQRKFYSIRSALKMKISATAPLSPHGRVTSKQIIFIHTGHILFRSHEWQKAVLAVCWQAAFDLS